MSSLPRVAESTRERISREFDNLGPRACVAEITASLQRGNPEILDVARRWASDTDDPDSTLAGFAMFYRLLEAEAASAAAALGGVPRPPGARLDLLPRVTPETRRRITRQIDEKGTEGFTHDAVSDMEAANPELLQMAHRFASMQDDYLAAMQGLALVYACLSAQAAADQASYH